MAFGSLAAVWRSAGGLREHDGVVLLCLPFIQAALKKEKERETGTPRPTYRNET